MFLIAVTHKNGSEIFFSFKKSTRPMFIFESPQYEGEIFVL